MSTSTGLNIVDKDKSLIDLKIQRSQNWLNNNGVASDVKSSLKMDDSTIVNIVVGNSRISVKIVDVSNESYPIVLNPYNDLHNEINDIYDTSFGVYGHYVPACKIDNTTFAFLYYPQSIGNVAFIIISIKNKFNPIILNPNTLLSLSLNDHGSFDSSLICVNNSTIASFITGNADTNGHIILINISNKSAPTIYNPVNQLSASFPNYGGYLSTVAPIFGYNNSTLSVVDSKTIALSAYNPNSIISGLYAKNELFLIDISDKTNPIILNNANRLNGQIGNSENPVQDAKCNNLLTYDNNTLFLLSVTEDPTYSLDLHSIDISVKTAPVILDTVNLYSSSNQIGSGSNFDIINNKIIVYFHDYDIPNSIIKIIDISNLNSLSILNPVNDLSGSLGANLVRFYSVHSVSNEKSILISGSRFQIINTSDDTTPTLSNGSKLLNATSAHTFTLNKYYFYKVIGYDINDNIVSVSEIKRSRISISGSTGLLLYWNKTSNASYYLVYKGDDEYNINKLVDESSVGYYEDDNSSPVFQEARILNTTNRLTGEFNTALYDIITVNKEISVAVGNKSSTIVFGVIDTSAVVHGAVDPAPVILNTVTTLSASFTNTTKVKLLKVTDSIIACIRKENSANHNIEILLIDISVPATPVILNSSNKLESAIHTVNNDIDFLTASLCDDNIIAIAFSSSGYTSGQRHNVCLIDIEDKSVPFVLNPSNRLASEIGLNSSAFGQIFYISDNFLFYSGASYYIDGGEYANTTFAYILNIRDCTTPIIYEDISSLYNYERKIGSGGTFTIECFKTKQYNKDLFITIAKTGGTFAVMIILNLSNIDNPSISNINNILNTNSSNAEISAGSSAASELNFEFINENCLVIIQHDLANSSKLEILIYDIKDKSNPILFNTTTTLLNSLSAGAGTNVFVNLLYNNIISAHYFDAGNAGDDDEFTFVEIVDPNIKDINVVKIDDEINLNKKSILNRIRKARFDVGGMNLNGGVITNLGVTTSDDDAISLRESRYRLEQNGYSGLIRDSNFANNEWIFQDKNRASYNPAVTTFGRYLWLYGNGSTESKVYYAINGVKAKFKCSAFEVIYALFKCRAGLTPSAGNLVFFAEPYDQNGLQLSDINAFEIPYNYMNNNAAFAYFCRALTLPEQAVEFSVGFKVSSTWTNNTRVELNYFNIMRNTILPKDIIDNIINHWISKNPFSSYNYLGRNGNGTPALVVGELNLPSSGIGNYGLGSIIPVRSTTYNLPITTGVDTIIYGSGAFPFCIKQFYGRIQADDAGSGVSVNNTDQNGVAYTKFLIDVGAVSTDLAIDAIIQVRDYNSSGEARIRLHGSSGADNAAMTVHGLIF